MQPAEQTTISDIRRRLQDHVRRTPASSDAARPAAGKSSTPGAVPKLGPFQQPAGRPSLTDIRRRLQGRSHSTRTPLDEAKSPPIQRSASRATKKGGALKVTNPGRAGPGKTRGAHDKPARRRFLDRRQSGELERLTRGTIARRVKLAEQFRMFHQGDVARRLGLHQNGAHVTRVKNVVNVVTNVYSPHYTRWHVDHHYYGSISPSYVHDCFPFHHWGPFYYPHYCWYPYWSPWVSWCWQYHCDPLWDPRPLWCQPVVYAAAPSWVYYEVPVWVSLPVVTCGTWVDVEPAEAGPQYDLQLLAIRFVDPGHPEEQLGPRYRVWFRNNSDRAITQPFDVFLFASGDQTLWADLPQAGVRVTSVPAGEVQSVDIRLPIDVLSMRVDQQGRPAPFATLHAVVDANREVSELSETNNGAAVAREEILPVDPAAFELEPTTAAAGGEVVLAGEGFGPAPGQVLLHLGGIEMEAEILGWYDLGVRLALPHLPLAGPTQAELIVIRGDGAAANPLQFTMTPSP